MGKINRKYYIYYGATANNPPSKDYTDLSIDIDDLDFPDTTEEMAVFEERVLLDFEKNKSWIWRRLR